ncbi:MAG: ABC transporter permease, partial [Pseudobacter sp.]|uniref:ABC transporter permease n=1 Tax=Pseudobacter sp. TaxID=2045420 RepID=UPI003F80AA4F
MKTILNIALTELQKIFYSPIAWLILIIFSFQSALVFVPTFDQWVKVQLLNYPIPGVTLYTFAGFSGLFTGIQNYLYLYIPLLTMGIMSREYASGSIKLLYSSPLTNFQIILGKYLSLVV